MRGILILIFLYLLGVQLIFGNEGYRINNNEKIRVDEHGICKEITNLNYNSYFIPTKTRNEWYLFRNNLPNKISLSECYTYEWQKDSWSSCNANPQWGDWSSCTRACGGGYMFRKCYGKSGIQTRNVYCIRNDGMTVSDNFCYYGYKPEHYKNCELDCKGYDYKTCNSISCYNWYIGPRSGCIGFSHYKWRKRDVYCKDYNGNKINDSYCDGNHPEDRKECVFKIDCGGFGFPSPGTCGEGSCAWIVNGQINGCLKGRGYWE